MITKNHDHKFYNMIYKKQSINTQAHLATSEYKAFFSPKQMRLIYAFTCVFSLKATEIQPGDWIVWLRTVTQSNKKMFSSLPCQSSCSLLTNITTGWRWDDKVLELSLKLCFKRRRGVQNAQKTVRIAQSSAEDEGLACCSTDSGLWPDLRCCGCSCKCINTINYTDYLADTLNKWDRIQGSHVAEQLKGQGLVSGQSCTVTVLGHELKLVWWLN